MLGLDWKIALLVALAAAVGLGMVFTVVAAGRTTKASLYEQQVVGNAVKVITHDGIPFPFDYVGCLTRYPASVCDQQKDEYEKARIKYIWERANGERMPSK